ncbi:MAG: archease [Candidatus Aminicenantes bacterium]|nr:archease [Candidatus Aminicenantes bacterium]
MERYRILEHTADGKFRAFGRTLEEAFGNAALACASLMWDWEAVERRVVFPVEARGRDREQLLCRFLEEILYLLDTRDFLLGAVEDLRLVEEEASSEDLPERERVEGGEIPPAYRLTARFVGDDDPARYEFHGDVKAITYNEMKIERGCEGWIVQVVVDM